MALTLPTNSAAFRPGISISVGNTGYVNDYVTLALGASTYTSGLSGQLFTFFDNNSVHTIGNSDIDDYKFVNVKLGAGDDCLFNDLGQGDGYSYGQIRVFGEKGDDRIVGSEYRSVDDQFFGGDDDDYLSGGLGNDILIGDNVTLAADGKTVKSVWGTGNDEIYGGDGDDYIDGAAGNNELYGDDGHDKIYAGAGNDYVRGGDGNDVINAGDGYNEVYGDDGDDKITTGKHADKIDGGDGCDTINAGGGADLVCGGDGDDVIHAGAGNDDVFGGAGRDVIYSDGGYDLLSGGEGSDKFVFTNLDLKSEQVVTDFHAYGSYNAYSYDADQMDFTQIAGIGQADIGVGKKIWVSYGAEGSGPVTFVASAERSIIVDLDKNASNGYDLVVNFTVEDPAGMFLPTSISTNPRSGADVIV